MSVTVVINLPGDNFDLHRRLLLQECEESMSDSTHWARGARITMVEGEEPEMSVSFGKRIERIR